MLNLKYRGVNYQANTADVQMSEEVIGRYRGAVVTRHCAKNAPAQSYPNGLKYRGAAVR